MKIVLRKSIASVCLIAVIFVSLSPVFAEPTYAQGLLVPTNEMGPLQASIASNQTAQTTKQFSLDGIAWMIANMIIQRIAASTISWINSGFNGSPAFITDPDTYFTNLADDAAGQFILSDPKLNFLCSPIQAKIRIALAGGYLQQPIFQCSLTKVGQDLDSFMNNFENGGWDSFFQVTQNQSMNPIGAYMMSENIINDSITKKVSKLTTELNQGSGFLSYKKCTQYNSALATLPTTIPGGTFKNADGSTTVIPDKDVPGSPGPCLKEETETPGSVIQGQLNKVLGSGSDRLNMSTQINQIVSALLSQLISQVMGGVGGLLGGGSSGSLSSTGGSSLASLLLASSTSPVGQNDIFNNTQNTSTSTIISSYGYFPTATTNTSATITAPVTSSAIRPTDNDCANISDTELASIAQDLMDSIVNTGAISPSVYQSNGMFSSQGIYAGEDISQIIQNMDCPPEGIR